MEKGQSQSKANKGMHRFVSGHSFAVLFALILLSMLVFNHLKKKKKSAEKESTEGASAPSSSTEGASAPFSGTKGAEGASAPSSSTEGASAPFFSTEGEGAYDVFLSFRGSDTRNGLADYLYHSLLKVGTMPIYVFRDDESLPIGEEFGSQLLDAIKRSKISIPIISENYASSKWCLRELVRIMECKESTSHIVLPIFYKVDPSDVRYLKGNFGRAFDLRKERFDENDIQDGRRALTKVSYLNGWESEKIANGREGELVEKVIKTVLSKLRPDFHLDVTKCLVGFNDHAEKIRNWLDTSASDARMIGIYGMGGIGKTTLAKMICNELSNDFVHCSFLLDIREAAHRHGITCLQKQLIKDIWSNEEEVWTVDAGIRLIKARLKGKKVLILLDDIDHKDHLNALAGHHSWFTSGSIIIVTTRNKDILVQSEFKVQYKYELNGIDGEHSLILFRKHAFDEDYPFKNFKKISYDIISTLGGLPLALEVIGSYLYKKSQNVWDEMLKRLQHQPYVDVQKILKISYDALENDEKEIFLDIACFFIGKESKFTIYMWDDPRVYPNQAIDKLESRCLIKIGDDGILRMHDQLRDLGRSIWHENEAFKVLMEKKSRRVLQLREAALSEDFSELRWLQLVNIDPNLSFSTSNLHLPRLVVLQLSYNQIKEDWRGWTSIMAARRLKVLDFTCCENLKCTPDLSVFIKLEILILKGCQRLEQVHHSIGKVKSLISLDLSGCGSLKELPGEVVELEELKELILDSAGITEIPMSIGSLKKLEKLVVRACRSLREIPSSIWDLQNLRYLDISESVIEKLPGVIGRLKKPDRLNFTKLEIILKDCYRLEHVHPDIGKVKSIVTLDLSGCGCLEELPEKVGELNELKELILDSAGITEIPASIGFLRKLEKLSARACWSLREIPSSIGDLENLQHLDISDSAIEKLPSAIGRLKKLRSLSLESCCSLKGEIPSEIGNLSSLEILQLSGASISDLPASIQNLSSLQHLSLEGCNKLRSLPELPSGLKFLRISSRSPRLPQGFCPMYLETFHVSWTQSCST